MAQEVAEKIDGVVNMLIDVLNRITNIERSVEDEHIRGRLHAVLKIGAAIGLELKCISDTIKEGRRVC